MTSGGFDITTGANTGLSDIGEGLRRAAADLAGVWIPAHGFGPLCGFLADELNSTLAAVRADLSDGAGAVEQTADAISSAERLLRATDDEVAQRYTNGMTA